MVSRFYRIKVSIRRVFNSFPSCAKVLRQLSAVSYFKGGGLNLLSAAAKVWSAFCRLRVLLRARLNFESAFFYGMQDIHPTQLSCIISFQKFLLRSCPRFYRNVHSGVTKQVFFTTSVHPLFWKGERPTSYFYVLALNRCVTLRVVFHIYLIILSIIITV